MADRPILFSAPMVRAILREIEKPCTGKTQTRRIIKPVKMSGGFTGAMYPHYINGQLAGSTSAPTFDDLTSENGGNPLYAGVTPYCPGDRLWVRESLERANGEAVGYPADGTWLPNTPWEWMRPKLPSIHMPRRLSRLTLSVTCVKVERLQDISEDDALHEGICRKIAEVYGNGTRPVNRRIYSSDPDFNFADFTARRAFELLWNEINGFESWKANPWVVAVTFRPILANIDRVEALAA